MCTRAVAAAVQAAIASCPVEWQGHPAASGRGLSVPGSHSSAACTTSPPALRGCVGWGKQAFVSDLKRLFKNGFHSLFFFFSPLPSLTARKRGKATPRIHSKRKTKRRRGSSQMLMFCFFDINLRTHMGVFIDSCSHLLNFLLFI